MPTILQNSNEIIERSLLTIPAHSDIFKEFEKNYIRGEPVCIFHTAGLQLRLIHN